MKLLLPIVADVGHGILATFIAGLVLHVPLTWHFLVGIAFALLPDIDAVPRLLRTGSAVATKDDPQDHREFLHYPILFLLGGILISVFSMFWGLLFLSATMFHFLNDTWGTGYGIAWAWPFSKQNLKFCTDDQNKNAIRVHDAPSNQWIEDIYLHVNLVSVIEYTTFFVAFVALVAYFLLSV